MFVPALKPRSEPPSTVALVTPPRGDSGSLKDRARSAGVYAVGGKLLTSLLAIPTTLMLVRGLSVQEYGVFSLIGNTLFLASTATNLGTLGVVQRFVPEFSQKGQHRNVRMAVAGSSLIRLSAGLLFCFGLLAFDEYLFDLLKIPREYSQLGPLLGVLVLLTIEGQLLGSGALSALLEIRSLSIAQLVSGLVKLTALGISFWAGYGLEGAVAAWALAALAMLLVSGYCFLRATKSVGLHPAASSPLPYRRMLRYGALALTTVLGSFAFDITIDNFVIAHYLGTTEVGRYTFAVFVASLAGYAFPMRILTPLLVNVGIRRVAKRESARVLRSMFGTVTKLVCFGALPAIGGLVVLSTPIIEHILNPVYTDLEWVVIIVLAFSFFRYLNFALQVLIKPLEILQVTFYTYGLSVVNLLLDVWLVPTHGIVGAAWATGLTLCVNYLLAWRFVRGHIRTFQDWKGIRRCVVNVLIMVCAVALVRPFVEGPLSLGLAILAGVATYTLCSWLNRPFRPRERDLFNRVIGRPLFIF